jgi:subtilisin family serine protease
MAGDPVAVVQARSARALTPEARESIHSDLRAKQDAIRGSIEANGAVVLGQYQDAINGIKVETPVAKLSALSTLLNVVSVKAVATYELDNSVSVPFIGAPAAWAGTPGLRGENVRVAIIDTGIDYTHANFGGPGTPKAYTAAHLAETLPADPQWFGPGAPKVKGGIDLAGDLYNPDSTDPSRRIPHPDPNPLDCYGHGSHVAGTAAGFGVTSSGEKYGGPYTPGLSGMRIGPGVAPLADLYAVRVFGCEGSTDLVVDAIDWSVANDMQVINMSLGASFGTEDDASAEAASNAADSGIVVVASAGNSGPNPYITGSPATGTRAISVAAVDSTSSFPGALITLASGAAVKAINANNWALPAGTLSVYVLRNSSGGVSLGCSDAEYVDKAIAGKLVVAQRGTCPRVDRAKFASGHGAAAVAMINDGPGFPPFEGDIPGASIPFLGVQRGADGNALAASASASLQATTVANPTFRGFASFSSGGPRQDGYLKPDVSAPGVSIISTEIGTGAGGGRNSGTSMAAPHVAGVAALALQAHPGWEAKDVRLAIVNTADPSQVAGYTARLGGAGLVQPYPATRTSVIASSEDEPAANFGKAQIDEDFTDAREVRLRNLGSVSATFNVSTVNTGGSPRSISVSPASVTVPGGGSATVVVSLRVPVATVGSADFFRDVRGFVAFSPATADMNNGVGLTVPYYFVPRGRSLAQARLSSALGPAHPSSSATVSNLEGLAPATADFYAWGLSSPQKHLGPIDLRAVGVQSFPFGSGRLLVFAINTYRPWTTASLYTFEIDIDTTGSGTPNYAVVAIDYGAVTSGRSDGRMAAVVFNLTTGRGRIRFLAMAPQDGSTLLAPVLAADLGLSAASPRFSYTAYSAERLGPRFDQMAGSASYNAWSSSISQGDFVAVPAGGSASVPITIDPAEWARTPALGSMIVTLDNFAGGRQAALLPAQVGAAPRADR